MGKGVDSLPHEVNSERLSFLAITRSSWRVISSIFLNQLSSGYVGNPGSRCTFIPVTAFRSNHLIFRPIPVSVKSIPVFRLSDQVIKIYNHFQTKTAKIPHPLVHDIPTYVAYNKASTGGMDGGGGVNKKVPITCLHAYLHSK